MKYYWLLIFGVLLQKRDLSEKLPRRVAAKKETRRISFPNKTSLSGVILRRRSSYFASVGT